MTDKANLNSASATCKRDLGTCSAPSEDVDGSEYCLECGLWLGARHPQWSLKSAALTPPTEPPSAGREGWKRDLSDAEAEVMAEAYVAKLNTHALLWGWPLLSAAEQRIHIAAAKAAWAAAASSPEPQPFVRLERETVLRLLHEHVKIGMYPRGVGHPAGGLPRLDGLEEAADAIISSARPGGE